MSINLSVKWHRTQGGSTTLKTQPYSIAWLLLFSGQSPLILSLECTSTFAQWNSCYLKLVYASWLNSFLWEGKNQGNHHSAGDTSLSESLRAQSSEAFLRRAHSALWFYHFTSLCGTGILGNDSSKSKRLIFKPAYQFIHLYQGN